MVLISKSRKIPDICKLTFQRLEGKLTQAELEAGIRDILHPEDELPLGVGASTEVRRSVH